MSTLRPDLPGGDGVGGSLLRAAVSEGASLFGEEPLPTDGLSGCKLGESRALEPLGSLQTAPDTQVLLRDCRLADGLRTESTGQVVYKLGLTAEELCLACTEI